MTISQLLSSNAVVYQGIHFEKYDNVGFYLIGLLLLGILIGYVIGKLVGIRKGNKKLAKFKLELKKKLEVELQKRKEEAMEEEARAVRIKIKSFYNPSDMRKKKTKVRWWEFWK